MLVKNRNGMAVLFVTGLALLLMTAASCTPGGNEAVSPPTVPPSNGELYQGKAATPEQPLKPPVLGLKEESEVPPGGIAGEGVQRDSAAPQGGRAIQSTDTPPPPLPTLGANSDTNPPAATAPPPQTPLASSLQGTGPELVPETPEDVEQPPEPTPLPDYSAETDMGALEALYHSTSGQDWMFQHSPIPAHQEWLTERHLGQWFGVTTDANGRVVELDLCNVSLQGTIPAELGNLSELRKLCFRGHDLTGPIPPELGKLANLTKLTFSKTQLTGPIPPELGNLVNLTKLEATGGRYFFHDRGDTDDLVAARREDDGSHGKGMSGAIPPELGNLVNLTELSFRDNYLEGPIPPELGQLTRLVFLDFRNNSLTGQVPPELGKLVNLKWLSMGMNFLEGRLPNALRSLNNLEGFHYALNQSLCLPGSLHEWSSGIVETYLTECEDLKPAVTEDIHDRAVLTILYHSTRGAEWHSSRNWLTDAPMEEWHGVSTNKKGRVTALRLDSNNLRGTLPEVLGSLPELATLSVRYNQLKGGLPSELTSMDNLRELYFSDNAGLCAPAAMLEWVRAHESVYGQYCPDLPSEYEGDMGPLVALYRAAVRDNGPQLYNWLKTGPLEEWSGVYTNENGRVTQLKISWNVEHSSDPMAQAPGGPFPVELAELTELRILRLNGLKLTGSIPPELEDLVQLTYLDLEANELSGPIPTELSRLSNLSGLQLEGNQLSGPIPPWLGSMSKLSHLNLGSNDLEGTIPAQLANLSNLGRLDLSNNRLAGNIPEGLGNLPAHSLSLNDNNLLGAVPFDLGNLSNAYELRIHGNRLTGELPRSFLVPPVTHSVSFQDNDGLCVPTWMETELRDLSNYEGPTCPYESSPPVLSAEARADREVLVGLYEFMGGPNWTRTANWLSEKTVDHWSGITVNQEGRVIGISLNNIGLEEQVPPELALLSELEHLYLQDSGISGNIPPELGKLENLRELTIFSQGITGQIPRELSRLKSIEGIGLSNRGPIPSWLGQMTKLKRLNIGGPPQPIPPGFENLVNLEELSLNIEGPIPPWIGSLAKLKHLALWGTEVQGGIPPELGNLTELIYLSLGELGLTGPIPPELGKLTKLKNLHLYRNQLTGPIPPVLGQMHGLESLELSDNQLTGNVPPELGNLTALYSLSLWNNPLTGTLPESIVHLDRMEFLHIGRHNGLCVTIAMAEYWRNRRNEDLNPICLDGLSDAAIKDREILVKALQSMGGENWSYNSNWVSHLPLSEWDGVETDYEGRVTRLYLRENGLTGTIPQELGGLSRLKSLNLSENDLTGPIPTELGGLSSLTHLTLDGNELSGPIPAELGNLSSLLYLSLDRNYLTGTIPRELASISGLVQFYVYQNRLTGKLPENLGKLSNLEYLAFHNNSGLCASPELANQLRDFGIGPDEICSNQGTSG